MDLGVIITDVTAFASTTLTGFGPVIAGAIGLGLALHAIRAFVRR